MNKFFRAYLGYYVGFLSYKIFFNTLSAFCDQVDEIISDDMSDNKKFLSKNKKFPLDKIQTRGGEFEVGISFTGKGIISIITKPISKAFAFLIMKFPPVKKVLDGIKMGKVVLASIGAFCSLRLIASYDYWALIFSDSLPQLPIDAKAVISGIRRLRIGQENMALCIPRSNEILNLVMDEEIPIKKKEKALMDIFSFYELLPDHHVFKNRYFACIIHLLLGLFIGNKLGFRLALRLLYRLLKNGKISMETYREILSQLVIAGVSTIDVELEN